VTAEKRVGRYVECYPELSTLRVDTIPVYIKEIEYKDTIFNVVDSLLTDEVIDELIAELKVDKDSSVNAAVVRATSRINASIVASVNNALTPIDTNGVRLSYRWEGNTLVRDFYVEPRVEQVPVAVEKIEVKPQGWFDFKETYWAITVVVLLMVLLVAMLRGRR
jgi:hypothetical protein